MKQNMIEQFNNFLCTYILKLKCKMDTTDHFFTFLYHILLVFNIYFLLGILYHFVRSSYYILHIYFQSIHVGNIHGIGNRKFIIFPKNLSWKYS